jgi:hypothetical protein
MSEKEFDSELIGWVDEPYYNDQGQLVSWRIRLKDTELEDILQNYTTKRDADGKGGNAYIKLFMSKNGKPCGSIYNFNSEAAKKRREEMKAKKQSSAATTTSSDDDEELPF